MHFSIEKCKTLFWPQDEDEEDDDDDYMEDDDNDIYRLIQLTLHSSETDLSDKGL